MKRVELTLLKYQREKCDWTQEMLAEYAGLSVRTIQRIESGGNASVETAKSIAAAMELPDYTHLIESDAPRKDQEQRGESSASTSTPSHGNVATDECGAHALPEGSVVMEQQDADFVKSLRRTFSVTGCIMLVFVIFRILTDERSYPYLIGMGKWIAGTAVVFVLLRALGHKMLATAVGVLASFIIIFGGMSAYTGEVVEDFAVHGKLLRLSDVLYRMGSWGQVQNLTGEKRDLFDELDVPEDMMADFHYAMEGIGDHDALKECVGEINLSVNPRELGYIADRIKEECVP